MTTFALSRVPLPMVLRPLTAAELMQPRSLAFDESTSIPKAAALLSYYRLDAAPVVTGLERPVGWVTAESCAAWQEFSRRSSLRAALTGKIDWTSVATIASPEAECVPCNATSDKVAQALVASRAGRLFVVDEQGRLVGTVSLIDVLCRLGEADGPSTRVSRSGASQLC